MQVRDRTDVLRERSWPVHEGGACPWLACYWDCWAFNKHSLGCCLPFDGSMESEGCLSASARQIGKAALDSQAYISAKNHVLQVPQRWCRVMITGGCHGFDSSPPFVLFEIVVLIFALSAKLVSMSLLPQWEVSGWPAG